MDRPTLPSPRPLPLGRDAFFEFRTQAAGRVPAAWIELAIRLAGLTLIGLISTVLPTITPSVQAVELAPVRTEASHAPGAVDAASGITTTTRTSLWGLSAQEYARYRMLMQGIRGSISPKTLSPIEVLGIHARDDAERQRYAERWARMLHDDLQRIQAFEKAYSAAVTRLGYRDTPLRAALFEPGDRALLFASPDCPRCDRALTRLLARVKDHSIAGLDIYLVGVEDDDQARAWARAQDLDPKLVHSRRVTLNRDHGAMARLAPGPTTTVPYVVRRRGPDDYAPIDLRRL